MVSAFTKGGLTGNRRRPPGVAGFPIALPFPGAGGYVPVMRSRLLAVTFEADDPAGPARFWAGLLGREAKGSGKVARIGCPGAGRRVWCPGQTS